MRYINLRLTYFLWSDLFQLKTTVFQFRGRFLFHLLSATSKPFSFLSTRLAHAARLGLFYKNVIIIIILLLLLLLLCRCNTEDGHDDVSVRALYVGQEWNDFFYNDHLVEAADQSIDALKRVDACLLHRIQLLYHLNDSVFTTPRLPLYFHPVNRL